MNKGQYQLDILWVLVGTKQSPWNSPGQNTGVGSLSLLQQIFPTQESNWDLLHCRWILYPLSCVSYSTQGYLPKRNKSLSIGRLAGKGIGYSLQYSWASLVAQLVKNPLVMQETRAQSLGWEDLLKKGKATHSNILAWVSKSRTQLSEFHFWFSGKT